MARSMRLLDLPDGVLERVVERLDVPGRLRLGAANRRLHALADTPAFLRVVKATVDTAWRLDSLAAWLFSRATHVRELDLTIRVKRSAGFDVTLDTPPSVDQRHTLVSMLAACGASGLRRLRLHLVDNPAEAMCYHGDELVLGPWFGAALRDLRHLDVDGVTIGELRGFRRLESLVLGGDMDMDERAVMRLPPSLTSLTYRTYDAILPANMPELTRLHTLDTFGAQVFDHGAASDAATLGTCASLQRLVLRGPDGAWLPPSVTALTGLTSLTYEAHPEDDGAMALLADALPRMPRLADLSLTAPQMPASLREATALTALTFTAEPELDGPELEACRAVLNDAVPRMPHLRALSLSFHARPPPPGWKALPGIKMGLVHYARV